MKKNLFYLSIALLTSCICMDAVAQNARVTLRGNPVTRIAAANSVAKHHNNVAANKNGNSVSLPFALSGYYSEGFEAAFPPAGWQVIDILDPTYIWVQSAFSAYEGVNSAYMRYSDMGIDGEDMLIMPQFSCIATDSIDFWLKPEFVLYPPDTTFVLVSTTDSLPSSFTNVVATLAEGLNYPATVNFGYYSFSLSAFAGQDIYVAFLNKNTYGDGIFIDKVNIGTKPALNAQAVSIDMPGFIGATTNAPLATVKNDGVAVATFDVTMTITGGYSSVKTVTALGAGASQQITFDPWSPVGGTALISIVTQLAGDALPADDSIAQSINVLEEFTNYGWQSRAPMPLALFGSSPSAINSNDTSYIYAIGGSDAVGIVNTANEYTPYSDSWSGIAAKTMGSFIPGSFTWNGNVYVVGGYNPFFTAIGNVQIYSPATGLWTAGAPIPTPVGDFASGLYNDSLFYVIAGYDGLGDADLVQIYNPATNSWTTGTNYPIAAGAIRGGIVGNKIVVCGGYSQIGGSTLATTYVGTIDPSNASLITWVQAGDYPVGNNGRHGAVGSIDASSGLVVVTAGDPTGGGVVVMDYTFGFDVNTNAWKIGPAKITAVSNLANLTNVVDNDSLYIVAVGGYLGTGPADQHEWLNMGPYTLPTGINEVNADFGFSINPNPVTDAGHATLNLRKTAEVRMIIADVMGKEVAVICNKTLNSGKHEFNFNAAAFANGVYMVTLTVNGTSNTYKLVKE